MVRVYLNTKSKGKIGVNPHPDFGTAALWGRC